MTAPARPTSVFLLAVILAALSLVRMVDLHWHQHLHPPQIGHGGAPPNYIADASSPHVAEHGDHDVSLSGESGTLFAQLLSTGTVVALILRLALIPAPSSKPIRLAPAAAHGPPRRRRGAIQPPPSHAPPGFRFSAVAR